MKGRGEPKLASVASWLVLAASFGLSAATWIALAELAGFSGRVLGLFPLAWLMPAVVDGYVVVALVLWMSPVPRHVARHARFHTYVAGSIGVVAQSAYHCLTVLSATGTIWRAVLAAGVGALPPAAAAFSVHMRALGRREAGAVDPDTKPDIAADVQPVPAQVAAPVGADIATDAGAVAEPARTSTRPAPKRSPAVNARAAAAMQSDGMTVPEIADVLGLSERQVRRALKPVPIGGGSSEPEPDRG